MTKQQKISAVLIGISLIIMTIAAGIAYGYAFSTVNKGDATTLQHVLDNLQVLTIGNIAWSIIIITDLIVSIAVYYFLKPYHNRLAGLAAISRLVYTIILTVAFVHLLRINDTLQLDAIMNHFNSFETIWTWGLILFGLHLVLIGMAHFSTKDLPNLLGILLIIAGLSYVLVDGLSVTVPDQTLLITTVNNILMLPMVVGELGFGLYVLYKAKKSS